MAKKSEQTIEVCAICGKIAKDEDYETGEFFCSNCECNVSVVMSKEMFRKVVKEYGRE